jgi:hypothetical protein
MFLSRRWLLRLLGTFLVAVLVTFGWGLVQRELARSQGVKDLEAAHQQAAADDPDWRWDDLNAKRPRPPEGRNGADLIPRIFAKTPKGWDKALIEPEKKPQIEVPANERYSDELLAELRKATPQIQEAVELARTMRNCPFGRRDLVLAPDVITTRLEDTQNTRSAVYILKWDVVLAMEDRKPTRAAESILAQIHVSKSIGDEPFLISQLVRIASRTNAMRTLEWTLAQGELPADKLAELQAAFLAEADEPLFYYGLRGERAAFDRLMSNLTDGTTDPATWREVGEAHQGVLGRLGWWHYRGKLPGDHAEFIARLTEAITVAKKPVEEQVREARAFLDPPFDPDHRFTRLLYPAIKKVVEAQWRTTAEMRCIGAAIACERFRMSTGRWPESLNELVPMFIPAVPRDPFDAEPLRLKRTEDGIVVYSIGLNRQDDGGDTRGPTKSDALDEGVRLWDVKARRVPAPKPADLP